MDKKSRVVIVGGGTAGWMTAAYLSKVMERGIEITVIESPNVSKVGVGEATFSTLHLFFETLGLREEEWMPHCNGSYKMAIRFVDWNRERRHFYHPFQRFETIQGRSLAEWWLKVGRDAIPFDYACFTSPMICDAHKSPRYLNGNVYDSKVDQHLTSDDPDKAVLLDDLKLQYPYGYHFDAILLARFMEGYAKKRGVTQVCDDVIQINLAPNGHIESLDTKSHGRLPGDLFIDCTGFRGLLINDALKEPFISFSDSLLCDRAVAMQVPSDPKTEGITPYTTATALSSGWVWNIPLFNRIGTGYVYSSAFRTPEEAEQELRSFLGKRSENCHASHIRMRVGRNRNSWVGNCVAIGLSSGFVEPLESTGIFFIQHAVEQLVSYFPGTSPVEENVRSYNRVIGNCIDGVREFLTLHYVASSRADTPFWKATKTDIKIPAELAERMKLWKMRLPTNTTINPNYHGFEAYSYSVMLLGLGHRPEQSLPILNHVCEKRALAALETIRRRSEHLASTLPSAYEYLCHQHQAMAASVPA